MSIEMLRALILADPPTATYPLCFDPIKRLHIAETIGALTAKRAERDRAQPDAQSLAEEPAAVRIGREIADLETQLEAAFADARDQSLVLIFTRLPAAGNDGASYAAVEDQHTDDKGKLAWDTFADELLTRCFLRAESADGEDIGVTWADVLHAIDVADLVNLRALIIGHHRMGASIPLDPRSSGRPETT